MSDPGTSQSAETDKKEVSVLSIPLLLSGPLVAVTITIDFISTSISLPPSLSHTSTYLMTFSIEVKEKCVGKDKGSAFKLFNYSSDIFKSY